MKVFVDTNILVDFVCRREPYAGEAKELFARCYIGEFELATSALSFVNAVYISKKYKIDVKPYLKLVSAFIDVVDLQGLSVVEMLSSDWKDYEDACQNHSAILSSADCVVTRNKKDFKDSSLPIYTITELFGKLEEK